METGMESDVMEPQEPQTPTPSGIQREEPDIAEKRKALVTDWLKRMESAESKHRNAFATMKEDMEFAQGWQWGKGDSANKERVVVNIVQRYVLQKVAGLYAKNPVAKAKRRQRMESQFWDGTMTGYQQAQQSAMMGDPMALLVLKDYEDTRQHREMVDRICKTLELLYAYQLDQQDPPFKQQMKQVVRRAVVSGVAYVKLGMERAYERKPEDDQKMRDEATQKLAEVTQLAADAQDEKLQEYQKEMERLQLLLKDLQNKPNPITREGLVFDYPASTSILIDPRCTNLKTFAGAQWVAQKYYLMPDAVKQIWGVDLMTGTHGSYRRYTEDGQIADGDTKEQYACVYEIYSKNDRLKYVVVEGWCDFLEEPATPEPKLERFWPFFPLVFNLAENDESIYPQSDVRLLRPMQLEWNRSREGLRDHRFANRPKTFVRQGAISETDKANLETHPANAVIEITGLGNGEHINNVLQAWQGPTIAPELYSTEHLLQDFLLVGGSQEANMGPTGDSTATESSIAESSRMLAMSSSIDDVDDLLTDVARASGQVLLAEFDPQTVKLIVGQGAVWPEMSRQEISQEILLEIQAGSSGKPNKGLEVNNMKQLLPFIMQMPGLNVEKVAEEVLRRFDERLNIADFMQPSTPSIVAMNSQKQPGTGNPESDPNAQGPKGGGNPAVIPMPQPNGMEPQSPQTPPQAGGATAL